MEYLQVNIPCGNEEQKEITIALLENAGYEGFEEKEDSVAAYINKDQFNKEELEGILAPMALGFTTEIIAQQNWNSAWESNFEPVIIEEFCTIRASFHDLKVTTPYEIVITPKMSFGTGHHATTLQMVQQMAGMDFIGKRVLDFGTGTGILAILAEMLGATEILAIDNDGWAYENTKENIGANNCRKVEVQQGSLELAGEGYDIILANINRHILLEYMNDMYNKTKTGGHVLMSGLLREDRDIVEKAAAKAGFQLGNYSEHNNWISLLFKKMGI